MNYLIKILASVLFVFLVNFTVPVKAQEYKVAGSDTTSGYNSDVIDYDIPAKLSPGQSYPISITIVNNGKTKWTKSDNISLKLYNETDNNLQSSDIWGINKVDLPNDVYASDKIIFSFKITAPPSTGDYNMKWAMWDGIKYFGEYTSNEVKVGEGNNSATPMNKGREAGSNLYDASFVLQTVPSSMLFNEYQDISITMTNSGSTTWKVGSEQLVLIDAKKTVVTINLWNTGYIQLPNDVEPGGLVVFNFKVKPVDNGWQYFQCSMMRQSGDLFGTPSKSVEVLVFAK